MKRSTDIGTWIGILGGAACIITGLLVNGANLLIYIDISSVFITIGGSLGALFIATPMSTMLKMRKYLGIILKTNKYEPEKVITQMVSFSEKARREGLLALEDDLETIEDDFMRKGMHLVVDGTDPEIIKSVLFTELGKIEARHEKGQLLFDDWGKTAPAFGMIGTLTGLIAMLARLEDKSAIGAGMSQALLTTLYGAVLSYLFLIPFKRKLEERNKEEVLMKEIMIEGILGIQSGDNPRILEDKLISFVPPEKRDAITQETMKD